MERPLHAVRFSKPIQSGKLLRRKPPAPSRVRLSLMRSCPLLEEPASSVEDCQQHYDLNPVGNRHISLQALGPLSYPSLSSSSRFLISTHWVSRMLQCSQLGLWTLRRHK